MHFTKFLALVGLFAGAALAAPNAEPNPPKPDKPVKPQPPPSQPPTQQNACGNGAVPYCCNTDGSGYGSCYAFRTSPYILLSAPNLLS